MNSKPAKIADALTTEYVEFLDYCVSSGKTYTEELTNADYIAFRTSRGLSRDYVAKIRKIIEEYSSSCYETRNVPNISNASDDMANTVSGHTIDTFAADLSSKAVTLDEVKEDDDSFIEITAAKNQDIYPEESKACDIDKSDITHPELDLASDTEPIDTTAPETSESVLISLDDIINNHFEEIQLATLLNIDSEYASNFEISLLNLSVRSFHCLRSAKYKSLADVLSLNINELKGIKNLGLKSISEILFKLQVFFQNENLEIEQPKPEKRIRCSEVVKNAVRTLLNDQEVDFSSFSDEDYSQFSVYSDSLEILDPELAKLAFDGDKQIHVLFDVLNSFADPYIKHMAIINDIQRLLAKLPTAIKKKKALPFMVACEVCTKKALAKLMSICDKDAYIFQLPNLLDKYKDSSEFKELSNDAKHFLTWLNFDVDEIINNIISKTKASFVTKSPHAIDIFKLRLEGKSLKQIGTTMSITRERVRQLESKVCSSFWYVFNRQKPNLVMLVYALRNGDNVIYYNELFETLGDFASILWACLKKAPNHNFCQYCKEIDALLITCGDKSITGKDMQINLALAMQEIPEVFEEQEFKRLSSSCSAKYSIPEKVIQKNIAAAYNKTGTFYHRGRLTVVFMCNYILKERFPAGYKIADEFEGGRFKQYLTEFFGENAGSITLRAIDAKVMELGCLCDRGKYIHRDTLQIDESIIQAINDYIDASPRSALTYAEVFKGLADVFSGTQITNKYLLQGALKKYGCKFRTNRDYILKEDGISIVDELDAFVEKHGIIHKKDIFDELHSLDDIRLGQIVARSPNVYSIDNGYYIHASMFDIRAIDYSGIREYLSKACEDIPISIRTVYEDLSTQFPQFMIRNDFDDKNKLFAALNHMFGAEFKFSRPYIAKLGTGDISSRSVILQHLLEYDSIGIDELFDICETNNIIYVNLSYLCQLIAPDFIRVDVDTLMRRESAGVDDQVVEKVSELITEQLEHKDYVVASKFDDFIWMPEISVDWNSFLLESVCLISQKINPVFLFGNSLAHTNTVFVSEKYKGDTFTTMLIKIIKEKVVQGYFNTKAEIREWLLEEELIEGNLPNIIEGAQYFFVTNKGVQYTGKEID